jgi:hypothetical protein
MERTVKNGCRPRAVSQQGTTAGQRALMVEVFKAMLAAGLDPFSDQSFGVPFLSLAIDRVRAIRHGRIERPDGDREKWIGLAHEVGSKLGLSPEAITKLTEAQ